MAPHRCDAHIALLFGLVFACGCDRGASPGLSGDPSSTADGGDEASSAAPGSTNPGDDSGPVEQFSSADGAPPGVTFDCKPGTYTGTFQTHVGSDAGGLLAFYSLNIQGTLSIQILGEVTQSNGEIAQQTYSIAPGAELTGVDQSYGGHYRADLVGQLDCATKAFTGTLNNAIYTLFFDAGVVPMEGSLTGTYDEGDAGVPELSGTMSLTSPNLPSLGAFGPWTATLQ